MVNTQAGDWAAATVLVVDDEPLLRKRVADWLGTVAYRCVEAAGTDEALECLQRQEVPLVTLDITRADGSGLKLLAELKQRWPDTEVIVLSGTKDTATVVEAMDLGAYTYLAQPFDAEEVVFQVRKALERRELVLERRQYTRILEEKVREQMCMVRRAHEETILRLVSASRYRDEETGGHIKRTGLYCELFAQVLGWPAERVEILRMAAPMHDVGKIGIPDAILQKPGKLTKEEFEIMKTHTTIGAKMLEGSESAMLQMAYDIALCHHERWDGTGYPQGLARENIPEAARILAIVDVYDAMTHPRVYRKAMPEETVLAFMEQGRGTHFDPFLFGVFMALVPEMRRIAQENSDPNPSDDSLLALPSLVPSTFAPPLSVPAAV